jgi:hypothetical protein
MTARARIDRERGRNIPRPPAVVPKDPWALVWLGPDGRFYASPEDYEHWKRVRSGEYLDRLRASAITYAEHAAEPFGGRSSDDLEAAALDYARARGWTEPKR